ncbi:SDR family NAD(P)-dependent oxidoreductase, partial [Inquilinus limosus]|uniref:SDR family NAD(P)-dependent oxidoreductase n=1 Tax=Inquilinus limosus TaxID=171674 RepID=UPI003F5CE601
MPVVRRHRPSPRREGGDARYHEPGQKILTTGAEGGTSIATIRLNPLQAFIRQHLRRETVFSGRSMARKLQDAVVVITGASSGIGRAAAHAFAKRGAALVLAARRERALEEAAQESRNFGARAIAVPTDVTDPQAVQALARAAIENFGRIDVWVNNAAVTLFARFEEAPMDAYRRVIETNLFGYIHGARAALPHFREQGHGVLINNAS